MMDNEHYENHTRRNKRRRASGVPQDAGGNWTATIESQLRLILGHRCPGCNNGMELKINHRGRWVIQCWQPNFSVSNGHGVEAGSLKGAIEEWFVKWGYPKLEEGDHE